MWPTVQAYNLEATRLDVQYLTSEMFRQNKTSTLHNTELKPVTQYFYVINTKWQ